MPVGGLFEMPTFQAWSDSSSTTSGLDLRNEELAIRPDWICPV